MSKLLEADSIRKEFDTKQVLTDISIRCRPTDIIGLLGRNGPGKSTLLNILFGSLYTDDKLIRINREISKQPFKTKKISYLTQDNFLPKNLTVKKVVQLYIENLPTDGFFEDEVLTKVTETKIGNLSGGESRYLEVKLILSLDSDFVLLDEPFNGISPLHVELINKLVTENAKEKGIILTDHDYRNVLDVANKYYLLFDGGLKSIKTKEDLISWGYIPEKK